MTAVEVTRLVCGDEPTVPLQLPAETRVLPAVTVWPARDHDQTPPIRARYAPEQEPAFLAGVLRSLRRLDRTPRTESGDHDGT